jgi:hydrogenase-4 transcriptional activator
VDSIRDQLLDIWREACRHIQIDQSVQNITGLLLKQMPVAAMLVRRFQADPPRIETVAQGITDESFPPCSTTTELPPATAKLLMQWARKEEVSRGHSKELAKLSPLIAAQEWERDVLMGPLTNESGPVGVVVLIAMPQRAFNAEHIALANCLLEPFSVALENDRRLHELNTLREAAEADRRTLLTRLGRQDLNEEVVGAQTGLRHVMDRVQLVAQSDVPVLILGETGTGKEVVSRAIHSRSKRADGPFIRVNCGAIPTELIDSQLFGHEKGSFTGASEQHQGWFERADGGTLFLDEIGELPLAAQVRLLRVLQDHQVERVGGKQAIHVDVRIVAATHRDLAAMAKQRTFREDLWYRINVFPILLPRLRERIDDIPALVAHFARRAASRFGLPLIDATPADLKLLTNYSWPGNIRELGAVIDRAVILGNGHSLDVATSLGLSQPMPVPPDDDEPTFYEVIPESPPTRSMLQSRAFSIPSLDDAMREHIERALAATAGRIEGTSGAAAVLGINPHTLRARMKKLQIDWSKYRS